MSFDNFLSSINENISEALFRSNEEGLIYANGAYAEMFGFESAEDAIKASLIGIYKNKIDRTVIIRRLKREGRFDNQEIQYLKKDGTEFTGLVSATLVEENDGSIYWDGSIRDYTEEREVITQLLDREQLLKSINRNINEAIYRSKMGAGLVYANDEFISMFGYDGVEEIKKIRLSTLYKNPDQRYEVGSEILQNDSIENREIEFKRKDGSTFWGYVNSIRIEGTDGNVYFDGAIRDITEERESQKKLKTLLTKTIEQNQRLKDFSYITSHNFRASVANLMGLVSVLEEDRQNDHFFKMIKDTTLKLNLAIDSINDLLNFEKDVTDLKKENCNLAVVVSDILLLNRKTADDKKIEFDVSIPRELAIKSRPAYIQSIMHNLITNAMKYGVTEKNKKIKIVASQTAECVTLCVEDKGLGLDIERFEDKLFKLGARFHPHVDSGHGMGLYITKQLVETIGGKIEFTSKVGEGTKVSVYIHA